MWQIILVAGCVIQQFSSPLWLIVSIEDALHQPTRLLILLAGTQRHHNDWDDSETVFTSWQRRLALSVCSSKHFHLAHFWSSCLISLWRQKSFKPHSILGQHIYWGLAFQYLREINTAPWFMNPCHPPTGLVRGPSHSTLLLPLHTMGFKYQEEHEYTNVHSRTYVRAGFSGTLLKIRFDQTLLNYPLENSQESWQGYKPALVAGKQTHLN